MPFKELKFCYNWRSYQEKFLSQFQSHIHDNHLHVIAPPGSGKTILGLEIMRRLNKKTLILSPTLTIRNQWHERLQSFFSNNTNFENYSFDINEPKDVIFSTYQSLHSFFKKCKSKEDYFEYFEKNNIEVLILDEAHHLKNEWWKCLYELKEHQKQTVVALTATPPYDSDALEVTKYFKLCGDIDDEIAIPDLIKEGDLCPHQDYVYFSKPTDVEINFITDFRLKVASFFDSLEFDSELIGVIESHRFVKKAPLFTSEIYNNPEYFSALLIYLNHCKKEIAIENFYILGFDKNDKIEIPKFDLQWAQVLLQSILFTDRKNLIDEEVFLEKLENNVRKIHAIEEGFVDFVGTKKLYRSLSNSSSKLSSIVSIIENERRNLDKNLRAVILTDYIKKEFLTVSNNEEIDRLGVLPIFHRLRKILPKNEIAVLTGSIVIVHNDLKNEISKQVECSFESLEVDNEFYVVKINGSSNQIVKIITNLFEQGTINTVIGTKSLLGEGWDAPSINTLILASFVGSFVSSNQMRGRAIRSLKGNKNKTGNIWHLVCLDASDKHGGSDIATLKRRFDSYVGISSKEPIIIESGIDRLNLPTYFDNFQFETFNEETLKASENRVFLIKAWSEAVNKGATLSREIKQYYQGENEYQVEKQQKFKDVVRTSFTEITIGLSLFLPQFLIKNLNVLLTKGMLAFIYALITGLGITFGVKSYKSIKAYIQFGYLHKDLEKIGQALVDAMIENNFFVTSKNQIALQSYLNSNGDAIISIKGVSEFESALFINAIEQIIQPIQNPRYLIVKTNWFRKNFEVENYYSVPDIFGDKKANILVFEKHWQSHVGKSKIVYTRFLEGRKLLLKARMFHVSNSFKETTKKAVIWN